MKVIYFILFLSSILRFMTIMKAFTLFSLSLTVILTLSIKGVCSNGSKELSGVPLGSYLVSSCWHFVYLNCLFKTYLGIIIENSFYNEVANITEKTVNYINNGIKYGRNKWAFKISIIKTSDSNEIIRAGISYIFLYFFFTHLNH